MGNVRRGDVGFSKGCPESWLTSPTYIYISMFNMSEMAFSPNCSMQEALIDSTTGFFMTGFDDYITKPDQFYNPPPVPVPLWMAIHSHSNCPRSRIDLLRRMHMFWSYHSIRPKARAECYSKSRSITSYSGMQTTETTYILRS
ncbi:hypothetical protein LEP1GSC019_0437 [Leptospira interrogans serovar Pyrogenes str. 2006006960]|nr:hypothetical protein LEP1GSC019_0437 [Leptospira interrogans serovar Pyrogenes str. 2006006960]